MFRKNSLGLERPTTLREFPGTVAIPDVQAAPEEEPTRFASKLPGDPEDAPAPVEEK